MFFLLSIFTWRRSLQKVPYLTLSAPGLILEYWLDTIARPKYDNAGNLTKAGDDLEAAGLTEFFWDIIYWTWINIVLVVFLGNRGWYLYVVVPIYAIYLAVTTFTGVRKSLGGLAGGPAGDEGSEAAASNRQKKLEKRGGQKMSYR